MRKIRNTSLTGFDSTYNNLPCSCNTSNQSNNELETIAKLIWRKLYSLHLQESLMRYNNSQASYCNTYIEYPIE